jgi:hypothetical protein
VRLNEKKEEEREEGREGHYLKKTKSSLEPEERTDESSFSIS